MTKSPRTVWSPSKPCPPVSWTPASPTQPPPEPYRQPPSPPWDRRQIKEAGTDVVWTRLKPNTFAKETVKRASKRSAPTFLRDPWLERVLNLAIAMPEAEAAKQRIARWGAIDGDDINNDEIACAYALEALRRSVVAKRNTVHVCQT